MPKNAADNQQIADLQAHAVPDELIAKLDAATDALNASLPAAPAPKDPATTDPAATDPAATDAATTDLTGDGGQATDNTP